MSKYMNLDPSVEEQIEADRANGYINPYRTDDSSAIRRVPSILQNTLVRPNFIKDSEKIIHLPQYNRYNDKTQVFSFYRNDDITRRGLHVQLVSRIARNIGLLLGLNTELIEAIALGHDIGHTPFGHAGEYYLSNLLNKETGRFFNHNVHSSRVLDKIYRRNISLQTLDGILCHNGEFEQDEYHPVKTMDFDMFDKRIEDCYTEGKTAIDRLVPMTLEGCVVRICDMIAYIGKDRQDAKRARLPDCDSKMFTSMTIGTTNAEIINNLIVDIVNNSYRKNYIMLSSAAFNDLKTAKKQNYKLIYNNSAIEKIYKQCLEPMFSEMYYKLLDDVLKENKKSVIYLHHIDFINDERTFYGGEDYSKENPHSIVTDYIAGMTDDYFVELYKFLFPNSKIEISYKSYFDGISDI